MLSVGILGIFTESSGEVEVQTPYANDLGSGWFYYVAHTSNGSYASDYRQHCIRKLDSQSGPRYRITQSASPTWALVLWRPNASRRRAGEWQAWAGSCQPTSAGFKNAKGNKARFYSPHGICSTARGDVVVADTGNHCVRSISQAGESSNLHTTRMGCITLQQYLTNGLTYADGLGCFNCRAVACCAIHGLHVVGPESINMTSSHTWLQLCFVYCMHSTLHCDSPKPHACASHLCYIQTWLWDQMRAVPTAEM